MSTTVPLDTLSLDTLPSDPLPPSAAGSGGGNGSLPDTALAQNRSLETSLSDVLARARERLLAAPPAIGDPLSNPRGDHDGQPEPVATPDERRAKPAAVLVPIVARPEGATLLLTQRTAHLAQHAGQIAFPGGKIDAADASPAAAALREAWEEIGLPAHHADPVGYLDAYLSGTGYRIVPVVAVVPPDLTLAINPVEVADVFEAPLSFLMDPARHERHAREWRGKTRHFYAIPYAERYIWGVTAGIIRNLYERLYAR